MDRLETMSTFVSVVRHASFTAAADQLGLSRSVVSKHIAGLENRLKVQLLNRTTRSVIATEAGRRYFEFCSRMLSEMRLAEEELGVLTGRVDGRLAVACPKWPGNFDVSEALSAFCAEHPAVQIELSIGGTWSTPYEFIKHGFDISLETGPIRDSRIRSKKIGEVDYILVASPDYLAARGIPKAPTDLLHHDCLVPPTELVWRFLVEGRPAPLKTNPRFTSNSFPALRRAAIMGLGIAMVPHRIVVAELQNAVLSRVLDDAALETTPLFAAYAPDGILPRKVRALLDFLPNWFKDHNDAGSPTSVALVR